MQALKLYQELLQGPDPDPQYHTYAAACLYHIGSYDAAEEEAQRGPRSQLQARAPLAWGVGRSSGRGVRIASSWHNAALAACCAHRHIQPGIRAQQSRQNCRPLRAPALPPARRASCCTARTGVATTAHSWRGTRS